MMGLKELETEIFSVDEQCEITSAIMDSLESVECTEDDYDGDKVFYNELLEKYGNHKQALFEYCFKNNIYYSLDTYKFLTKSETEETMSKFPEIYVDTINADPRLAGKTFFSQIKMDNFEKIYSEDCSVGTLSDDDKKNRQVVIDIFSYDPFKDESIEDRPQLYRDLAGMSNENMRKDIAKQKAALSIVRSYNNIEQYQHKVRELTAYGSVDEETQKLLESYMKVISNIQSSVNQTAEKNNFTVKGIGSNGKGMLSDVMNQVEEMGIDEGITNFYDVDTSKSIEQVANISFKAQLNQINLSKTDYVDIMTNQCELVRKSQRLAKDALEALRLAKEKIIKQELLEELRRDYLKKGISEDEIEDFLSREYSLYDGRD